MIQSRIAIPKPFRSGRKERDLEQLMARNAIKTSYVTAVSFSFSQCEGKNGEQKKKENV